MLIIKFIIKLITKILSTGYFLRLLYNVDIGKHKMDFQTGFASLLMKKSIKKYVKNGERVLDIGTGPYALHSIWMGKNMDVDAVATDINDEYIKNAVKVMALNKVSFKIIKSDLFKNIKGRFEWAIFNPPDYRLVERLLEEAPANIKLMLSMNLFYINRRKAEGIIKNSNYKVIDIMAEFLNPAKVFILEKKS
ncbi:methyltransferase [Candidatus Woesearchaeota archaeon]|nr:methyltransferase [Candidatus Woesearchaeota archaeon]